MVTVTGQERKAELKRVVMGSRFAGIAEAAMRCGVSKAHMWYVLAGERKSPRRREFREAILKVQAEARRRQ